MRPLIFEEESGIVPPRPQRASRPARRVPFSARLARSVAGLAVLAALGGVALLGLAGSGFAAGQSAGSGASAAASGVSVQSGADLSAGRELYMQTCAACHGVQGQGVPRQGPTLQGQGAAGTAFALYTGRMPFPENGVPSQPRDKPILTQAQIQLLVNYVAHIAPGPTIPPVDTSGADIAAGRQLFINNCAACHGPDAAGGAIGGPGQQNGFPGVFIAPSLHSATAQTIGEAVVTGPGPMPKFNFPLKQIDEIAAYIKYLQSAPSPGGDALGGLGPVPEGYVAVAIGLVLILLFARLISRRPLE
ncbi:MAG: c-type cytochrome [Chloroflexi bacterium]|nr:c-type cytochrome [Chloroflexota bacterium]